MSKWFCNWRQVPAGVWSLLDSVTYQHNICCYLWYLDHKSWFNFRNGNKITMNGNKITRYHWKAHDIMKMLKFKVYSDMLLQCKLSKLWSWYRIYGAHHIYNITKLSLSDAPTWSSPRAIWRNTKKPCDLNSNSDCTIESTDSEHLGRQTLGVRYTCDIRFLSENWLI